MTLGEPYTPEFLPHEPEGRLERDEVRADLGVAWRLVLVVALLGVPLGLVWTWVAPVEHVVLLPGGATGRPRGESNHAFDAVAVFVLLLAMFGVIAAAVAWRMRHRRGPVLLVAAVLGPLLGGGVATFVGVWLAPVGASVPVAVDRAAASAGEVIGPPVPAMLTALAPSPGPWWIGLVAGLAGVLTYVVAAIADGHEDMGRDEP